MGLEHCLEFRKSGFPSYLCLYNQLQPLGSPLVQLLCPRGASNPSKCPVEGRGLLSVLRRSSEPCPAGSAVPVQRPPSVRRAEASVQLAPAGPLPLLGDVSSRGLPASQPPLAALRWRGWPADRRQRPAWKLPQNCHRGHLKEPNQPKPTGCCQGRGVQQHPLACWGGPGTPQPSASTPNAKTLDRLPSGFV